MLVNTLAKFHSISKMRLFIAILLNCATDIVALFLREISPSNGLEIIRSKLLPWHCQTVLKLYSKKLRIHIQQKDEPAIYLFNHQGRADLIILGCLGFTHTRFFISRSTLWLLPLTLFMKIIKAFYLSDQQYPNKRKAEFTKACIELKKYHESAIISPEGRRSGEKNLLPFNKGAFYLAKELNYPIIQLFIEFTPDGFSISELGSINIDQVRQLNIEELRDLSHVTYSRASNP
ncbi:MAG: hypothetical protein COW00_04770 [Bdellovibrio sp. CG12_big_fil_rev_8_21_14_0_65_39_13]|nr:MAG: hypothetical protein COW78_12970 [Bdellovibrio sp. CG22_combo_CG10-13_8_21_14_all_39_27]PIQ61123.1 MAG: hypothetical protein COW00_04770 [Bdellovibrio sp. CG12_big_fil_rev_8_21_14_0_65_39_13]PIR36891.1 MAG: hypothetical protein COV37_01790 [Bdellovibrio sp. CG11_big_fil_rev_8_21_14_0_20_39_38]